MDRALVATAIGLDQVVDQGVGEGGVVGYRRIGGIVSESADQYGIESGGVGRAVGLKTGLILEIAIRGEPCRQSQGGRAERWRRQLGEESRVGIVGADESRIGRAGRVWTATHLEEQSVGAP